MANIYAMADTWDDAGTTFTGIGLNVTDTASASASLLMDLQVGGSSKFKVDKSGGVFLQGPTYFASNSYISWSSGSGGNYIFRSFGADRVQLGAYVTKISFALQIDGSAGSVSLVNDGANILAQRNSTNAQTFNLYNTYTDASNYERGFMKWNSNVLEIGTEAAGTGGARLLQIASTGMFIKTYGLNNFQIGTTSSRTIQFDSQGIICNAINYIRAKGENSDFSIGFNGRSLDTAKSTFSVIGHDAASTASVNLEGGDIQITAGSGASASAGNAHGGNLYVRGGTGYGTGHDGYVIMDNLPTADPLVSGALWNDSGTLKISA